MSELLDPTNGLAVPLGQAVHASEPSEAAYVPGSHGRHSAVPASDAYVPKEHGTQLSVVLAPYDRRAVPGGHCVHCRAPSNSEYVPGKHCIHVPVPGESVKVPVVQGSQSVTFDAPVSGWYKPACRRVERRARANEKESALGQTRAVHAGSQSVDPSACATRPRTRCT